MQLLAQELGGRVERAGRAEYGKALLTRHEGPLFRGLEGEVQVWMSHQDAVTAPPPGWRVVAETEENPVAAIASPDGRAYGVQFHPEVAHTPKGMQILENFLELAGVKRDWTPEHVLEELLREVRERAGKDRVLLAVSGGWTPPPWPSSSPRRGWTTWPSSWTTGFCAWGSGRRWRGP